MSKAPPAIPEWVPTAVSGAAQQLVKRHPRLSDLMRRLMTDKRMAEVWRKLKKTKPSISRSELVQELAGWKLSHGKITDSDAAMVLILCYCILYGTGPNEVDTVKERRKAIKSYQNQAKRLRSEAKVIRNLSHSLAPLKKEKEEQAKILEGVAAWCDQEAASIDEAKQDRELPAVERDTGWLREIGLCDMLVDVMESIYGKPLRPIVAELVNVIFGRKPGRNGSGVVTEYQVRDWIRALRKRQK
jgi:hypothetical protein